MLWGPPAESRGASCLSLRRVTAGTRAGGTARPGSGGRRRPGSLAPRGSLPAPPHWLPWHPSLHAEPGGGGVASGACLLFCLRCPFCGVAQKPVSPLGRRGGSEVLLFPREMKKKAQPSEPEEPDPPRGREEGEGAQPAPPPRPSKNVGAQQPVKRGQKSKLKKIREKYKDQDEEDRELIMQLLGSAGSAKDEKPKKARKGKTGQDQARKQPQKLRQAQRPVERARIEELTPEFQGIALEEDPDEKRVGGLPAPPVWPHAERLLRFQEEQTLFDSLTGQPHAEDVLLFAIPVCAPYTAMTNYNESTKYLVEVLQKVNEVELEDMLENIIDAIEKQPLSCNMIEKSMVETAVLECGQTLDETRAYYGNINFFGGPSSTSVKTSAKLKQLEQENEDAMFVFLSDVWLDQAEVLDKLRIMFSGSLKALADIICEYPSIHERPPLTKNITAEFRKQVPFSVFTTNPCRVQYCTQEIIIFREDLVNKMCRNCVRFPCSGLDIPNHFVKTILSQGHLTPLPLSVSPVYWAYDYTLRTYPLPDLIVFADKYDPFTQTPRFLSLNEEQKIKYLGCNTPEAQLLGLWIFL
ncbi:DNA polymerase epsilon subunit 2 [Varanus komodoensis]|nr:DNA polymerase epsilon subunit 2 [Varanus komodoensis]